MLTYQQTIAYLYSRLPVFHRVGAKAFKADLSNTLALCEHLQNPQNSFTSIHVGGTNGKGSSSHLLAAILQSAGYNVGLYTSPHLKDYTERFRYNGKTISEQNIINFVENNQNFIEKLNPSFFEMSVALAFDYFRNLKTGENSLDIAVIEVGLGGRLDSTNIISPILSLITNIGLDHTDILGETLPKIAFEKAGIIKVNTPVVISENSDETDNVFVEQAKSKKSNIFFAEKNYTAQFIKNDGHYMVCDIINNNTQEIEVSNLKSSLIGIYQLRNIAGVYQAIQVLRSQGYKISEKALRDGFQDVISITGLRGRWQILDNQPLMICDTGHNVHGLTQVLKQIDGLKAKKKHFILGFVKDKDIDSVLKLFPKDGNYYFCEANSPRSMLAENLINKSQAHGLHAQAILNVNEAVKYVKNIASFDDLIFIGGSTFVVAELNNL